MLLKSNVAGAPTIGDSALKATLLSTGATHQQYRARFFYHTTVSFLYHATVILGSGEFRLSKNFTNESVKASS